MNCERCDQPVNTAPGGDGLPAASGGVIHDRCRRDMSALSAKRTNDRRIAAAPLFAHAGLVELVTPEQMAARKAAISEHTRQWHAAREQNIDSMLARAGAVRARVVEGLDPVVVQALDGRARAMPRDYAEAFWKDWEQWKADGRLEAWAVKQREAAQRAAALRDQVAELVIADRLAQLDAFILPFGAGEHGEIFWRARLHEARGGSLAQMGASR